jgi:hypothetical protein
MNSYPSLIFLFLEIDEENIQKNDILQNLINIPQTPTTID